MALIGLGFFWLAALGAILWIGIPLMRDPDTAPFNHCSRCGGCDETGVGICDMCYREIGGGA